MPFLTTTFPSCTSASKFASWSERTTSSCRSGANPCRGSIAAPLILRSCAEEAGLDEIADDILAMRQIAEQITAEAGKEPEVLLEGDGPHTLAWREWVEPADVVEGDDSFVELEVDALVEQACTPQERLDGQATAYVEPTRALVAIDVNTGADGSFAAGLRANIALARALPRILRVRGLGGQIVLDLAPMPKKERRGFETVLRAALRADDVDTVLAGWTPLGLYELQRKRARLPLAEVLS